MKTLFAVVLAGLSSVLAGCSGDRAENPETVAVSPPSADADYALFALRCSKCHSLSRPLNSGIDRDDYWRLYVAKMRRQPGSGISVRDSVAILRFLHLYSIEQRRKKEEKREPEPAPALSPSTDASAPTGTL